MGGIRRRTRQKAAPRPDSKNMVLRKNKEGLLENLKIAEAILRYRRELVGAKGKKLLEEAEAKVEKATQERESLVLAIKAAPHDIVCIEKRIGDMRRRLKETHVQPKVERIEKLRAKIAALEKEIN